MHILLIQPKMNKRPMDTNLKIRMSPSLALYTIANIIPKEHKVTVVNENIEHIPYGEPVDLVGITVTVDVLPQAARVAEKYRERGVPVVAGGIHITAEPNSSAAYFDVICIGAAEGSWPMIVRDAEAGNLKSVYKGTFLPPASPKYSAMDSGKYLYTNVVYTSRSCPFNCDFCYNSAGNFKGTYVNRLAKDILRDIDELKTKHILFIDDNFIGNPTWTRDFLLQLKGKKVKWSAAVTANIGDMPDLLDLMRESGCQSLFIGFESLKAGSLAGVNKKQNQADRYSFLAKEIHRRGMMVNASFVFGLDEDDSGVFKSTLDWVLENKIETVTSHILTPYPGTKLYQRMLEEGRITDFDLSHYDTAHVVFKPKAMAREELEKGYLRIYRDIYSFKNILKRMPEARGQRAAYLLFNLLYRKFGKFSQMLCGFSSFRRIGRLAGRLAYRVK